MKLQIDADWTENVNTQQSYFYLYTNLIINMNNTKNMEIPKKTQWNEGVVR